MSSSKWCKRCGQKHPTIVDGEPCNYCMGYGNEGLKLLREAEEHEAMARRLENCSMAASEDMEHAEVLKHRAGTERDNAKSKKRRALEVKFDIPEVDHGW